MPPASGTAAPPSAGSPVPVASAPPPPLPASPVPVPADAATPATRGCIADPLEHAVQQLRADLQREGRGEDTTDPSRFSREGLADVDGDGTPEHLLVEGFLGTANNPHLLYLSNRGCVRYGGVVWAEAESLQVLPESKEGLHLLKAWGKNGCAGLAGTVMYLAWNGERYGTSREVHCGCPDETPGVPRDPECP